MPINNVKWLQKTVTARPIAIACREMKLNYENGFTEKPTQGGMFTMNKSNHRLN